MNRTTRTALIVTGIVVLLGALTFGAFAVAQTDAPVDHPASAAPWAGPHRGWGPWHGRGWGPDPEDIRQARAELTEDLGAELDRPAEQVEAAFRAVVAQRLDEAAAAGRIDRAQADEALAAYDEGELQGLFRVFKEAR